MTASSLLNPAYKHWLKSVVNPYETLSLLEKSEVSDLDLSDISEALEEYVRLFKAEIASPAEILTLSRAYPDEEKYSLAVIDKELDQNEPVVIGGPASVEVVDREGHIITLAAMERAFERFMANFRTRNTMVLHSDVQVGWALPAYISKTGKIYKSGVTGDHLFFITELRDDTKIAKKVLEQIRTGKMKSYSIAGSATSVEPSKRDGAVVMQVNDMELAEVTICEQGVNQRAKFELMKSVTDRPTSSCVDGSCLTKSNEHAHSNTELFVNADGIIDTVGSFINWVQKEELMKPNKNSTDILYAYLHKKETQYRSSFYKEIYNDPEDNPSLGTSPRPSYGSGGDEAARSRERVKAGQGKRPPTKWKGGDPSEPQEPKGKELLEMQKSHLEGCLCEECKQRTGDTNGDDTPRLATDTQGRPTLGHTGHGNVVAILIRSMQRKGRRGPIDRLTGGRIKVETDPKKKHTKTPIPEVQVTTTPGSIPDKILSPIRSPLKEDSHKQSMQKAVYEYINKATKEQQDKGLRAQTPDWKEPTPWDRGPLARGRTPEAQDRSLEIGSRRDARGRKTSKQHQDRPEIPAFDPEEWEQMDMQKAVYEYINKAKNPKPHKTIGKPLSRPKVDDSEFVWRVSDEIVERDKKADKESPFSPANLAKAVHEYINKAYKVPSGDELRAAGAKRKAAALEAAKERYGEDFTPAKTKPRPYRGPAPSAPKRTGAERTKAAQEAWREKNPGQPDPSSFTQQLLAFVKASSKYPLGEAWGGVKGAKKDTPSETPSTKAIGSTPDPRNLPAKPGSEEGKPADTSSTTEQPVGQQPQQSYGGGGGGRGFFNSLLDLYEGRGEAARTPAPAPSMQQMKKGAN